MDTTEQVVDIATADGPMATPTSRPADGGTHPGVIVIMEAFGVNPNIEGIVQRFASEGYVAAAPDLFHRSGRLRYAPYDKLQEMREELRSGGFGDASIDMDVQATIDYLRNDPNVGAIGIVGFCLGGRVTMQSAIRASGLSAAAVYYGGFMFPGDDQPEAFHALRGASRRSRRGTTGACAPTAGWPRSWTSPASPSASAGGARFPVRCNTPATSWRGGSCAGTREWRPTTGS